MNEEHDLLASAVSRLEQVTAALQAGVEDPDELKRLADTALGLSAEISDRLPRIIRQIEDAAQGRGIS